MARAVATEEETLLQPAGESSKLKSMTAAAWKLEAEDLTGVPPPAPRATPDRAGGHVAAAQRPPDRPAGAGKKPADDEREARAAEVMAMLRSLPVSKEPPTEEELAIFEEAEAELRSGTRQPGLTTAEIWETIEQMRRNRGE